MTTPMLALIFTLLSPGNPDTSILIDFESAALGFIDSGLYYESNYTLADVGYQGVESLQVFGVPEGFDSHVLSSYHWARKIRLTQSGGGSFDLISFDYGAGRWANSPADTVVTASFINGATASVTVVGTTKTMTTETVNWNQLESVVFDSAGGVSGEFCTFDNLVVRSSDMTIAPTADAGTDQTVTDTDGDGSENITLDGSGSADSDGTIASQIWSENGTTLSTDLNPVLSFDVGTHILTLTVTDNDGLTDSATVTITVNAKDSGMLVESDFMGTAPALNLPWTPTTSLNSDLLYSGWTLGAGLTAKDANDLLAYSCTSPAAEADATLDNAIVSNHYLSVTLEALTDPLDLRDTQINFTIVRTGYHASRNIAVFTSVDGFSAGQEVFDTGRFVDQNTPVLFSFMLPNTSAYSNLSGSVEFRLVGYGGQYANQQTGLSAFSLGVPINPPPTADAGTDQTIIDADADGLGSVTLDGSGSGDSNGTIVSQVWSEDGTTLSTSLNPTLSLAVGSHTLILTVTDNEGATGQATVTITVHSPPHADAGTAQTLFDTDDDGVENVTLDGSGSSDADGTIVSHVWSENTTTLSTDLSPMLSLDIGTHILTLTVTDNDGLTASATVTIVVSPDLLEIPALLQGVTLRPGFSAIVGCEDAEVLIQSQLNGKYIIQAVLMDETKVETLHADLAAEGAGGTVSVALSDGTLLPYIDNTLNALIIEGPTTISQDEMLRVVAPFGSVLFKEDGLWVTVNKPYPSTMDDWPMFAHDLKRSNIVQDQITEVPTGLQWLAGTPMGVYMVNQAITSEGRIFYSRSREMKNAEFTGTKGILEARDAFNGILLWKKELQVGHAWKRNCLAAEGDRLYAWVDEGMAAIDASSGEILQLYPNAKTKNVSVVDDKLIIGNGTMALDIASGDVLWENKLGAYTTDCLITSNRVITTDKKIIRCFDLETGVEAWSNATSFIANADVKCIWEDLIFATDGYAGAFYAFNLSDGTPVWDREDGGFTTVLNGLGWVFTDDPEQAWVGLDPRTGIEQARLPYGAEYVKGPRCYPARATENFFLPNFGGLFFMDPVTGDYTDSFAGRGTCRFGWLPSNGMIYQPVNTCSCYPLMRGDLAFSSLTLPDFSSITPELIQGPAFSRPAGDVATIDPTEWPTLRGDADRLAQTDSVLGANLTLKWQASIADNVSSPVIAGGKAYVAVPELHQVVAVDADTGAEQWRFTASGTIDSPPTIAGNLVLFGSADGWAYCLDSADGALRWRFRAAPIDRRIICREQIESLWPVPGNLLAVGETVYLAAGRHAELNGGIFLYALDATTGSVNWKRTVTRPDYQQNSGNWDVDSCNNRVLVHEGGAIQLDRHFYNLETGVEQDTVAENSFWGGLMGCLVDTVTLDQSPKGELFKYWTYTKIQLSLKKTKAIQIYSKNKANGLAIGETMVFGIRQDEHRVFANLKSDGVKQGNVNLPDLPEDWVWEIVLADDTVINSILVFGDTLLVGGSDSSGSKVWKFSTADGTSLGEIPLPATPRFDGLAIAGGELFVTTQDGRILCLSGE